ncbi:MAG: TIGR03619 family F420-dependent LLM class oxidoreductase [Proteobacteria bacterium]|nr:TIGR03619 family F420-dependent LLM class oxidoreductase [Pseudomonadota bacterium]
MQFGLHLGIRGPAADPDSLRIIAAEAEALGFAHLGFSDHVVIAEQVDSPYPYTKSGRWFAEDSGECLEQVTTLGFVAAATRSIRLLTSVMVLPHRPPVLTAKMLNTVDVLSKGRLTVGLGVGWMAEEIALLGGPAFADRGKAADEYIQAFRVLWTEEHPRFHGAHVQFEGLKFFPKPVQSPHPPLWVGGEAKAARRRAGRLGDGWYPVGNNPKAPFDTAERYAAGLADVAGRDPSDIARGLFVIWYKLGEAEKTPDGDRRSFTGPADAILEDIDAYRQTGLEHLVIGGESGNLEQCLDRMRRFESDVMRRVT